MLLCWIYLLYHICMAEYPMELSLFDNMRSDAHFFCLVFYGGPVKYTCWVLLCENFTVFGDFGARLPENV